jgi:phosphatidylinositol-3-phosphatase
VSRIQFACVAAALLCLSAPIARAGGPVAWPANLPVYDHIVIVIEENKDYDQIIGNKAAPYINRLASEGARLTRMFGEEHNSQGNYFWLFSGSDQGVGFNDQVPGSATDTSPFKAGSLGQQLIKKGLSFKGYAESLPAAGATATLVPANCSHNCIYGRRHVPWISFAGIPNGRDPKTSTNLRFSDFPASYDELPTVAFVVPDLNHDMHNGNPARSIPAGDGWLRQNLDTYYQWAKTHNSLLIVTFDESDDKSGYQGLTDPGISSPRDQASRDRQNRIATVFAGAHVKPGYAASQIATHVNILRTIEAMYGLPKSGAQQINAVRAGAGDGAIADIFEAIR